ncbi:hypothetical protein GC194_11680 [bacterium]|nr:hypothetical protein [bacterium]
MRCINILVRWQAYIWAPNAKKMESLIFSKIFWGAAIILIGISFIAQAVFKIHLPVGRIIFSLFFIYLGVKMLLGGFGHKGNSNIMSSSQIKVESLQSTKYDVVFGSQVIDFTQAVATQNSTVEVNVVFGSSKIILPGNLNVHIESSSAFGSVRTPGNETVFGQNSYRNTSNDSTVVLNLKVNAVFGSASVFVD